MDILHLKRKKFMLSDNMKYFDKSSCNGKLSVKNSLQSMNQPEVWNVKRFFRKSIARMEILSFKCKILNDLQALLRT